MKLKRFFALLTAVCIALTTGLTTGLTALADSGENSDMTIGMSTQAVSYTHLDVYKRQVQDALYSWIVRCSASMLEDWDF